MAHIWNNDGEFGVECVVHLADGSFVTPEGVVVLAVLGVRVSHCGEQLVPRRGVGVRLWYAVRRLPVKPNAQSADWVLMDSSKPSSHYREGILFSLGQFISFFFPKNN